MAPFTGTTQFPFDMTPMNNISAPTYRDGVTYTRTLEQLKAWLNTVLVPESNAAIANAIAEFQAGIANAEARVVETEEMHQALVSSALASVAQSVTDLTNYINTETADARDYVDAMAQYVNNKTGASEILRLALNGNATLNVDPLWTTNHPLHVVVTQDATGGRTLTGGANIGNGNAGTAIPVNTAPNAVTRFTLVKSSNDVWQIFMVDDASKQLFKERGIDSTATVDSTAGIAAMMNSAKTFGFPVQFPDGAFIIDNLTVTELQTFKGSGGTSRFGINGNTIPRTVFIHKTGSTNPMITVNGGGARFEDIEMQGNGNTNPVLYVYYGFELGMKSVRIIGNAGPGIVVRRANNTRWYDVMVDNCGSLTEAAVIIKSPPVAEGAGGETNTFDAYGLTVERSQNVALDIGYGGTIADGYYAEFIRLTNLHVEAPTDNGGLRNTDGLVRFGNIRGAVLVNPFIYGGPGALIEHKITGTVSTQYLKHGVTIIGGHLLGDSINTTPHIVNLISGDEFALVGTRLGRFTTAGIKIESTYGANVRVDPTSTIDMIGTNDAWFLDSRTAKAQWEWPGVAIVEGLSVSGPAGTVRPLSLRTGTSLRWQFRASNAAEAGSGAGSDLELRGYADDGVTFSTPMSVSRSTGQLNINTMFRLPRMVTTARPAAANVVQGAIYFDTTLLKPVYSDGFNWKTFDNVNA